MCVSVIRRVIVTIAVGFALQPGAAAQQSAAAAESAARVVAVASAPHAPQAQSESAARVTLSVHQRPLGDVLREIASQGGVTLLYSADFVPVDRPTTVVLDHADVLGALREALRGVDVRVVVRSPRDIVLVPVRGSDAARKTSLQTGTVRGRVADAKTGTGIAGATVTMAGAGHSYRAASLEDGTFAMRAVAAGTYHMTTRRIGYIMDARDIVVRADSVTTVVVSLAESPGLLDRVTVTGTVVPTSVKALPMPISVVDAQEIQNQNFSSIAEAFRQLVPSALSFPAGSDIEQNTLTVRGASTLSTTPGIKTYIDGVEVESGTFTVVDPSDVDHIEVIRGPQAATIYGSDAIGGVLQIFTKRGDALHNEPQGNVKVSIGTVQSDAKHGATLRQDYAASIRGGSAGASYNIGGSWTHMGDWLPYYSSSVPSAFGAAHVTQGRFALDFSGRYMATDLGTPNIPFLVKAGYTPDLPSHEQDDYRQSTLSTRVVFDATPRWQHSLTLGIDGLSFDQHQTQPRRATPDDTLLYLYDGESHKTSIAYNTTVTVPVGTSVSAVITAGLDHYQFTSSSFYTYGAANDQGTISSPTPPGAIRTVISNTGVFGQAQLGLHDALFVTAGVRAERNSAFGPDLGTPVSPRVGISWNTPLGDTRLKLRASYGEAIKPPQPAMKVRTVLPTVVTLANQDLGPERQRGYDAGADVMFGRRATLGITYYDQTAVDLIQWVVLRGDTIPQTRQFQNVGRVRNRGLEVEGSLALSWARLSAQFALSSSRIQQLSATYVGDLRPGDQVLATPHTTAGGAVDITAIPRATLTIGVTYVGTLTNYDTRAQLTDFSRPTLRDYWMRYPAFTKVTVSLSRELTRNASAFVAVDNIVNNNAYESQNYLPTIGRMSMFGIRARF